VGDAENLAGKIANCSQWTRNEMPGTNGFEFKGTNGTMALLRRGVRQPDSLVVCSREAIGRMREASPTEGEVQADALKLQRQQAINGMPAAHCGLGKRYLVGDGVLKDEQLARFWLGKAAAKGDAEARTTLKQLDGK
jgi:TPR repeat protein